VELIVSLIQDKPVIYGYADRYKIPRKGVNEQFTSLHKTAGYICKARRKIPFSRSPSFSRFPSFRGRNFISAVFCCFVTINANKKIGFFIVTWRHHNSIISTNPIKKDKTRVHSTITSSTNKSGKLGKKIYEFSVRRKSWLCFFCPIRFDR